MEDLLLSKDKTQTHGGNEAERGRLRERGNESKGKRGRERYHTVSRPVLRVCYITIYLSRLDAKLGYWRKQKTDNHKENAK